MNNSLKDIKFNFVNKYKIWFLIPVVILLIAAVVFTVFAVENKQFSKGINIGIDFSGGTLITIPIGDDLNNDYNSYYKKVADIIKSKGANISYNQAAEGDIQIRYSDVTGKSTDEMKAINDEIVSEIELAFPDKFTDGVTSDGSIIEYNNISPSISNDLIKSAIISILITLVLMLIYILIRFEWLSGVAAVIALMHDVLMIFAFTIIFHIQINSSFVAAIITIVAYSINNTIVVFDRVRENMKIQLAKSSRVDVEKIVNESIIETLNRSLNTSITTIFMVIMLAIFGVATIREFALPIIFGLIAGTYSSLFIAPTVYSLIKQRTSKNAKPVVSKKAEVANK